MMKVRLCMVGFLVGLYGYITGSFEDEICTIGNVLQLNQNEMADNKFLFF